MKNEQDQVRTFMLKAGQACPMYPMIPDDKVRHLRVDLIVEELDELAYALHKNDMVGIADAIADLLVVVLGTAVACGIDIQPIWNEVDRSNASKFIDGYKRDDGKWMKGKSYSPPEIAKLIEAQKKTYECGHS